jgi:hypothetical protein
MNRSEAKRAILQRWISQIATLAPTLVYSIDNRKLVQPTPPFASVQITGLLSSQDTFGAPGNRRFLRPGWIDVRLYSARDQGTKTLDTLAEIVTQIFEARRIPAGGDIVTFATTVNELREDREYPDLWCVLCRTGYELREKR